MSEGTDRIDWSDYCVVEGPEVEIPEELLGCVVKIVAHTDIACAFGVLLKDAKGRILFESNSDTFEMHKLTHTCILLMFPNDSGVEGVRLFNCGLSLVSVPKERLN